MRDLNAVIAAIDAANAEDPNRFDGRGRALVEGERAVAWVRALVDDPSEELLIAARAHHLRRWEVPRSSYPEGRAGYLRWRRDQKKRHAADIEELMVEAGFDAASVMRARELTERRQLGTDDATQHLEDAACLTFLETQLDATARRLGDDATRAVLERTLVKMSSRAKELATELELSAAGAALLGSAAAAT